MSAGRFRIIVERAAYAKVAIAKYRVSDTSDVAYAAGTRRVIPTAEQTTTSLRAAPTDHPRAMSALDRPPPAKFPRSAARNGTQNASRLFSRLKPCATR